MPRSRNIKHGFFTNELLAECSHTTRVLFAGLWCLADRNGYLEYRLKRIKYQLFPYEECIDIAECLRQLGEYGFITVYSENNDNFIYINNFSKHQNPHKNEKKLDIPYLSDTSTVLAPEDYPTSTGALGMYKERCIRKDVRGNQNAKKPKPKNLCVNYSEGFLEIWDKKLYPRGGKKEDAFKAYNQRLEMNSHEEILEHIKTFAELPRVKEQTLKKDMSGIWHLATFLRSAWEYDPAEWESTQQARGSPQPSNYDSKFNHCSSNDGWD